MSLFQCERCGARENTALAQNWLDDGEICSECRTGQWHGVFEKIVLPKGMFVTDRQGNLAHKETGDTDISKYAISV